MTITNAHQSISLDGFTAGPDQSIDDPLGVRGMELHEWMFAADATEVDRRWEERVLAPGRAYVMGRNMFGPVRGAWEAYDGEWRGWWGDDPPYHAPVFVLSHHEHAPIEMAGGTTFHFVTDGLGAALERARAAGNGEVSITGGASVIRQALAAGELDELTLDIAPILLGSGERLFDGSVSPRLVPVEAEHSPYATHVRYRVSR